MIILCLDPGHGGGDGCYHNGIKEDHLNWQIVHDLTHHFLAGWPVKVELTRAGNQDVSLLSRAVHANSKNVDLYISIHADAATNTRWHGGKVFYRPGDVIGRQIAESVAAAQPYCFTRRKSVFEATKDGGWGRVFNCLWRIDAPAILYEVCYLSNKDDAKAIKRNGPLFGVVSAILAGVARFIDIDERARLSA